MPGLLDFLNTPESRLGIGLLAAAGPRADGAGFGQRLSQAFDYVDQRKQGDLKNKYMQAQMDNYQSEIENRKLAAIRDSRQQALISDFMGGTPSDQGAGYMGAQPSGAPAAPTAPDGTGGASGGAPAMGGSSGTPTGGVLGLARQLGIPEKAIQADMAFNGGKGIAAMLEKHGGRDMQVTNGYAYDKNNVGAGFMPSLTTTPDGRGVLTRIGPDNLPVVSAPRGALETFGAYQDSQAARKPIKVYNPATGREEYTTEGDVVSKRQSQRTGDPLLDAVIQTESNFNPNALSPKGAQGLMQVMPGTNDKPGFGIAPAKDNSETERTRVGQEYLGKLQERYGNPALAAVAYNWGPGNTDMWLKSGGDFNKLPAETKNYVAAVMTRHAVNSMGGGQPAQGGNYAAGPSMQEKSSAKFGDKLATEQADLLSKGFTAAGDAANDILSVQQARKAISGGAFQGTGADFKLGVAKFGASLGVPIDAEKATNTDYLKSVLGQGLLEKAKTLGSNPSNADASRITDIVGSIGKDPQAMNKILDWREEQARRAIAMHNSRVGQAEQSGYRAPYDMRVKLPDGENPAATTKPAGKVFDAMPTANASNKGQRIRDTTTGKILRSNGMQWKEE